MTYLDPRKTIWPGLLSGLCLALALEATQQAEPIIVTSVVAWLCMIWWIFEPIPIPVTSLLPIAVFPVTGVLTVEQVGASVGSPLIILLLAVPILIQVYFNSGLAYLLNRWSGEAHCVAAPSALIGASNFFELAVAAAIALFGFESGAALATVVGVLIEVPVMLSVVRIVNATKPWYERGLAKS